MILTTTQALLNEVMNLGYGRETALDQINKKLDRVLPMRKPIVFEILPRELYDSILSDFQYKADDFLMKLKQNNPEWFKE